MMHRVYVFLGLLAIGIYTLLYFRGGEEKLNVKHKNVITHQGIVWSKGWKKIELPRTDQEKEIIYQTTIGGSEFEFSFSKSSTVQLTFDTPNTDRGGIGVEVWLDEKYADFKVPEMSDMSLSVEEGSNKNKQHKFRARVYCSANPTSICDVRINQIILKNESRVLKMDDEKVNTLAVVGDSISLNYGNKNYIYILADKLGYKLLNLSTSGSTMVAKQGVFSGISRIQSDVTLFKPDLIIVFLGTNDLATGISKEHFATTYDIALATLKKELPEAKILTLGLLPRKDFSARQVLGYSQIVKNIAEKHNIRYISPYKWLYPGDFEDAIHPSSEGNSKLVDKLFNLLAKN